jgi:hypothetical protein
MFSMPASNQLSAYDITTFHLGKIYAYVQELHEIRELYEQQRIHELYEQQRIHELREQQIREMQEMQEMQEQQQKVLRKQQEIQEMQRREQQQQEQQQQQELHKQHQAMQVHAGSMDLERCVTEPTPAKLVPSAAQIAIGMRKNHQQNHQP